MSTPVVAALSMLPVVAALGCLHGIEDPLRGSPYWPFDGNSGVVPFGLGVGLAWLLYCRALRRGAGRMVYLAAGLISGAVVGTSYVLMSPGGTVTEERILGMYVLGLVFGGIASQLVYQVLNRGLPRIV
jgi:hypothetical protein